MLRALLIVGLLASGSAASSQSLVGKWDCNGREGRGSAIRTLQEYRANGSLYHLANFAKGDRKGRLDASVKMRGKWDLEGNRLVETITSASLRSLSTNGKDVIGTPIGQIMKRDLPGRMANGRPSRTTIKFVSPREFHMVSGRIKGVCTKRQDTDVCCQAAFPRRLIPPRVRKSQPRGQTPSMHSVIIGSALSGYE